jgi:hypothetical protein
MGHRTVVATANILRTLPAAAASHALRVVLDSEPDLVGLQEWGLTRRGLLRSTGAVQVVPGLPGGRSGSASLREGYTWYVAAVGGCVVGVRADRYEVLGCRPVLLGRPGRSDSPHRRFGVEPPRVALVVTCRDRLLDEVVHLVDHHLAPGAQRSGRYDEQRPLTARHHRRQVADLARAVTPLLARGPTYVVGDSNFHGLDLPGMVSAWQGREGPGTLGRRRVDDVHAPRPPREVRLLETGSDHRAVVATYPA